LICTPTGSAVVRVMKSWEKISIITCSKLFIEHGVKFSTGSFKFCILGRILLEYELIRTFSTHARGGKYIRSFGR
jgi:hypothetical protein